MHAEPQAGGTETGGTETDTETGGTPATVAEPEEGTTPAGTDGTTVSNMGTDRRDRLQARSPLATTSSWEL